jgi:hypothetical protein
MRKLLEEYLVIGLIGWYALSVALLLALGSGCATVSESLKDTTFYRRDIELKVNGQKARGAVVVPKADRYVIEGEVKGGFDFLIVRSCHREFTAENEGGSFKYVYEPRPGIEDNRACPLEIRGAEKGKGRHSFGFIDFQNARDALGALLSCNGEVKEFHGVSVCQSPAGLIQKIRFPVPVLVQGGNADCKIPEPPNGLEFEFKTPLRQCLFMFMEKQSPHRTHRMMTLGYEAQVIREF